MRDAGVRELQVSDGVVAQPFPHRQAQPVVLRDEGGAVLGGVLDGAEVLVRADAAAEQDLGRAEVAGRQDHGGACGHGDGAAAPARPGRGDLDAGDGAAGAEDAADGGVGPEREGGALAGGGEVGGEVAVALAVAVVEVCVREGLRLFVGLRVGGHVSPAGGEQRVGEQVVAFGAVVDAVGGGGVCPGHT